MTVGLTSTMFAGSRSMSASAYTTAAPASERDDLVDDAAVDVAERQEAEEDVGRIEVDDLAGGLEVVEHVAVAQHRALRVPGGARGVDHGRQVVAIDRSDAVAPRDPVGGLHLGTRDDVLERERAIRELAGRLERDDVLEGRAFGADARDLVRLLRVLDEDGLRLHVVDDERRLARLGLGIDRAGDGPERQRREIGDRPLRARAGDDADGVAVADAEVLQAQRQVRDPVPHLAVGAARPAPRVVVGAPPRRASASAASSASPPDRH